MYSYKNSYYMPDDFILRPNFTSLIYTVVCPQPDLNFTGATAMNLKDCSHSVNGSIEIRGTTHRIRNYWPRESDNLGLKNQFCALGNHLFYIGSYTRLVTPVSECWLCTKQHDLVCRVWGFFCFVLFFLSSSPKGESCVVQFFSFGIF